MAKAQCLEALAEAEMARTEAEKTHARAEQTRAGANEMCSAPTTALLLWQAEPVHSNSDSSRQIVKGLRTSNMTRLRRRRDSTGTPSLPARAALSTACSVHVSADRALLVLLLGTISSCLPPLHVFAFSSATLPVLCIVQPLHHLRHYSSISTALPYDFSLSRFSVSWSLLVQVPHDDFLGEIPQHTAHSPPHAVCCF